jgi:hypothetical protein
MTTLETNIDDLNPQIFSYVIDRLLKNGASDAFLKSVLMKKGRFGFLLTVVCKDSLKEKMLDVIFSETTSFGVKINNAEHIGLDKEVKKVKTKYGLVRANVGKWKGKIKTVSPEYKDCSRLARKKKVPLKLVFEEARKTARF